MNKDCWIEKIDVTGKGICIHHTDYINEAFIYVKNYELKVGEKLVIWQNLVGKILTRTIAEIKLARNDYFQHLVSC